MSRSTIRDARVGLVLLAAAAGLIGLVVVAGGGPGYLVADRTPIEVFFRDAQGIRVGHPVRIAGLEAGRVAGVDIVEHEGALRARVRLSIGSDLAGRLKQDAVIVIAAGLTGQSSVNIASVGESGVAWVPGQPIEGIESSLFDPLLEQVGLGPVERDHLSHTIGQVRRTIDDVSPRLQKTLAALQQAASDVQMATEVAGPAVAGASGKLDAMTGRLEGLMEEAEALVATLEGTVAENRDGIKDTIASARQLSARTDTLLQQYGPKAGELVEGLGQTRMRADRVLYQADVSLTNLSGILVNNRASIDRSIANVRDATDSARMMIEKLRANPLLISPLYKPGRDAELALANFDTANVVLKAASEFNDAVKHLEALRGQMQSPQQQQAVDAMLQRASAINAQIEPMMRGLAQGIQAQPPPDRGRGGLLPRE
ncbi:MlaD family protein [Tautonia plasticadhaerens]|uniref:Mce related protein n=1 Tax=Tautonia plasticadhaerens TaxID=2527974 RepID=A0A518H3M7_9BACT|nr:MlaD family protein [Tautonia plasticadhaerens]QDV35454.1 mce related protein [Tautonia plasticadhaerens]